MSQFEPCVGTWYAGERETGLFQVIHCELSSGTVHLRGADGRKVQMTLERWAKQPLTPAEHRVGIECGTDRVEWIEPFIG